VLHDSKAGRRDPVQHFDLHAHGRHHVAGRADEDHAGLLARGHEFGLLGQKAVAGMDRLGAGLLGDLDDLRAIHVAALAAQLHALVGQPHMQRVAVRRVVQRHRPDAHVAALPHNPHRNLAAVGD